MTGNELHIDDVFGVNRNVPLTYVERDSVDEKFIASLSCHKHIVVYGGSKQGKTSLRKHSLDPENYVVVQCSGTATVVDIYSGILKEAGAKIEILESKTAGGRQKLGVSFRAKISAALFGSAEAEAQSESEETEQYHTESQYLELDPANPNDIIRVLIACKFDQYIVIEDYHYLPVQVQKQLALDLKAFHEKSDISFIVVGVWLHQNRLVLYNGDLTNRVIPIDADVWKGSELREVITKGERLLNLRFADDVPSALISASQGNVGLLQELCHTICVNHGIRYQQAEQKFIGSKEEVAKIVDEIAKEQAGRYRNFISDFSTGFQTSKHELYKWIIAIVICAKADDLKEGLRQVEIYNRIRKGHPNASSIQMANIVQALRNVSRLQQTKNVQPVILDFNESENRLRIVDSGFLLFVERQDTGELLDVIGMALDNQTGV